MARSSNAGGRAVRALRAMGGTPPAPRPQTQPPPGKVSAPRGGRLAGQVPAAAGATEVLPADPDAVLCAVQVGAGCLPSQSLQRQRGLVPVPVPDLAAHRADRSAPPPCRPAPLLMSYRHR